MAPETRGVAVASFVVLLAVGIAGVAAWPAAAQPTGQQSLSSHAPLDQSANRALDTSLAVPTDQSIVVPTDQSHAVPTNDSRSGDQAVGPNQTANRGVVAGGGPPDPGAPMPARPRLFDATTTVTAPPAVNQSTTVRLNLTARTDAHNVTISLPEYRFVDGGGERFDLGTVTEGEQYTVETTVTPTVELARYLRFTARGRTADGPRRQAISHDLALVDRLNATTALTLNRSLPASRSLSDTTIDSWGDRRNASLTNASTNATASTQSSGTVQGCFQWGRLNNPGFRPGRQLRVTVWESDFGRDSAVARGRTDDSGCFSISVSDPASADPRGNAADVYVTVYAENPAARVTHGPTHKRYRVRRPSGSTHLGNGGTVSLGTFSPGANNPAYQAAAWSLQAYRFVSNQTGETRSQIRIQYPHTDWPTFCMCHSPVNGQTVHPLEEMQLPDRDCSDCGGWNRPTVHHEYGHGLWNYMYDHDMDNMPDIKNKGAPHLLSSETNVGKAMTEGWANFMEAAVQMSARQIGGDWRTYYNREVQQTQSRGQTRKGGDSGDMDGWRVEGAQAALWFDIIDGVNRGEGDYVNESFASVFDVISLQHTKNLDPDFWVDYRNANPGVSQNLLARLFVRNGIYVRDRWDPRYGARSRAVNLGANVRGPIDRTINATDDGSADRYNLTLLPDTRVLVNVTNPEGLGRSSVIVRRPTRRDLQQNSSTPGENIGFRAGSQGGTYTIRVRANRSMAYSLNVTTLPVNDIYEPNDARSSATPLPRDGRYTLRSTANERDYYAVDLNQGEWLNVTLGFNHYTSDLDLSVFERGYNSYTRVARSFSASSGEAISFRASDSGQHLIQVRNNDSTPQDYEMWVEQNGVPDRWSEPNNNRWNPTNITVPSGVLRMQATAGEDDYYGFYLQRGEVVNVSMASRNAGGELDVSLWDPSQERYVDREGPGNTHSIRVWATQTGPRWVEVEADPGVTNEYTLNVSSVSPRDPTQTDSSNVTDAVNVAPGTYRNLSLNTSDRTDVYTIDAHRGEALTAAIRHDHNSGYFSGTDVTIYGPNPDSECLDEMLCSDYRVGGSRETADYEEVDVPVTGNGTYYVEVSNATEGSFQTDYDLVLNRSDDDRLEDNDDFASAATLAFAHVENLHYHADDDYYRVRLQQGDTMNVTVRYNASRGNLPVYIYGPNRNLQASNHSDTDNATLSVTARRPGTWYIRVTGDASFDQTVVNNYTLDVEGAILTGFDEYLGVDETDIGPRSGLGRVGLGGRDLVQTQTALSGQLSNVQLPNASVGEYAIQLGPRERLDASVLTDTGGSVALTLYAANGTRIGSTGSASGADSLSVDPGEGGTYYLRATNTGPSGTDVSLDLDTDLVLSDAYEVNDVLANAAQVRDGRYPDLRIAEADVDNYAVNLSAGDELTVTTSVTNGASDLAVIVRGPDGGRLARRSSVAVDGSVSVTADRAGSYTVTVDGNGASTANYSLAVDVRDPDNDRFESNEEFGTATTLQPGTYDGLWLAAGDRDVYAVDLTAGQRLRANVTLGDGLGSVHATAHRASGEPVTASAERDGVERLAFTATESGTYYIRLQSPEDVAGRYDLSVETRATLQNDRFEANDARESATHIDLATYDDLRIVGGERDVFTVPLSPGGNVTVTTQFDHEVGDIELEVAGPGGEPLAGSRSATDDESVTVSPGVNGTYTVVVYGSRGASAPYDLTVRRGDAAGGDAGTSALDPRSIAFGETRQGAIDEADPQSAANRGFHEPVTFRGEAGTVVTATMQARDDAYLLLRGPDGDLLAANDDGGAGLHAQLTAVTLPETGQYTLVATSVWTDATFPYRLSLDRRRSGTGSVAVTGVSGTAIPGETVALNVTLTNTASSAQPLLLYPRVGSLPGDWEIANRSGDGGVWRPSNQVWLFQEIEPGASVDPSLTLAVPDGAEPGETRAIEVLATNGTVNDTATVRIPVREQTLAAAVDTDDDGELDDMEVLEAIAAWNADEPVADTGRRISDTAILDLIERWRTNEGVQASP